MTSSRRDFIVIVLGKLALVTLAVFSIKLSTKFLSPEIMGQFYVFTTIYTFFVLFLITPVGQYFNRYTHKWESEKILHNRLLRHFLYMIVISLLSLLGSVFLYSQGWTAGLSMVQFSLMIGMFVFVLSANQTVVPILNMLNHRVAFIGFSFLTAALALLLSCAFVINIETILIYWLAGILLANILVLLIAWFFLYEKVLPFNNEVSSFSFELFNKNKLFDVARFSLPVAIAMVFMWAQNIGYRMSVESLMGAHYLGLLGVGLMLSTQLSSVVESILMQYLHPIFYKRIQSEIFEERLAAANFYIGISIPLYFSLALFLTYSIEYIFPVLIDEQYSDGAIYCVFGVWLEFFRMTTNAFSNIAHSEIKMKSYMLPYVFGAVATNVLVYFSITSVFGGGVPLALLIGGAITTLLMLFYMRKLMSFSVDVKFLLLSALMVLPSIAYLNYIKFPLGIDFYYMFLLCFSGILFLVGWAVLFFIGKKTYGAY
ncbi:MAG: hypothetical protein RPR97_08335 [Colwellia sp.]